MAERTGGIPAPQRMVGRYEIVRQIGRGGMATVYLARQTTLDRNVALKELSVFHASSPEMTARFLRESRLAGSLNHPNVVTVHEYFEEAGMPFIAMEYVPRGSLRPYVGRLHLAQFAGVMEGILAGLTHAATFGIVHRDLKPENLMVTSEGRVKIADFGIAKATESAGTGGFVTATGMTIGTPRYMSPEQVMGGEIGIASDLYSVGVIAHEQAVGRPPFADTDSPVAILVRQVNETIPSARELNPSLDEELSAWIDRLLVKDPLHRTRTPSEAWDQLEEIVLRLLGPRWRRHARLPEDAAALDPPQPLTPAPFAVLPPPAPPRAPADRSRTGAVASARAAQQTAASPRRSADAGDHAGHEAADGGPEVRADQAGPAPPDATGSVRVPGQPPRWRRRTSRDLPSRPRVWTSLYRRVAIAAIAAGAGFVVAPALHARSVNGSLGRQTAAAGPVSVAIPSGWHREGVPAALGLGLAHALAVGSARPAAGTVIVGVSGARQPYTLPPRLTSAPAAARARELLTAGRREFYRYRNVRISGVDGLATVYTSATTNGTLIAICTAGTSASDSTRTCADVVSTLEFASGKPVMLAARSDYVSGLSRVIGTLNGVRASGDATLERAKRATDQASAAGAIARAYYRASADVRRLRAGASLITDNAALADAMRGIADGYTAIDRAARKGDAGGYRAGQAAVQKRSAALTQMLQGLTRSGYVGT